MQKKQYFCTTFSTGEFFGIYHPPPPQNIVNEQVIKRLYPKTPKHGVF